MCGCHEKIKIKKSQVFQDVWSLLLIDFLADVIWRWMDLDVPGGGAGFKVWFTVDAEVV